MLNKQTSLLAFQYDCQFVGSSSQWRTVSFEGDPGGIRRCIDRSRIVQTVSMSGIEARDAEMSYAAFVIHLLRIQQREKSTDG